MLIDMFPFPRITGDTSEEQISELVNYLIQFKETLEFALMNISTDNFSADLINKLNELGANIEKSNEDREDEITQISSNSLTISDVCNSELLQTTINSKVSGITFNVNFNTGYLEYATS
jgi:hypothetical protein